jgi:hypothetical protein
VPLPDTFLPAGDINIVENIVEVMFCYLHSYGCLTKLLIPFQIKMEPSKNGKLLSAGFGFVEFDSTGTAVEVCKQL